MQTEIRNSGFIRSAQNETFLVSLFPSEFSYFRPKKIENQGFGTKFVGWGDQEAEMQGAPGRLPDFRARKRERFVPNSENQTSLGRARCFFHTGSMNR